MISKGNVFGENQKVILHLLDIPQCMGVLDGVVMELNDCAFPLVTEIVPTADPAVAFKVRRSCSQSYLRTGKCRERACLPCKANHGVLTKVSC